MIFVGGLGVSTTADDLIEAFRAGGFSITVNPKIRKGNSFAYCPNVALANDEEVSRALSIGQIWVKDRFADVREYKNRMRDKHQNYAINAPGPQPSPSPREPKSTGRALTRVNPERINHEPRYYPSASPNYSPHLPSSPRYSSFTYPSRREPRYAYENERYGPPESSYPYRTENHYHPPSHDLSSQFAGLSIGDTPYPSSPTNVPYMKNGTTIYPADPPMNMPQYEHIVPPGLASVPN